MSATRALAFALASLLLGSAPGALAQSAGAPTAPSAAKPDVFHGTTSSPGNAGASSSSRNTPTQGETTGADTSGIDKQADTKDRTPAESGSRPSGSR